MFPNDYTGSIGLTVLVLIGLLIIRYLILRHKNLLFKFMKMDVSPNKGKAIIQIETTTKISKSSSLMIVKINDEQLLLGVNQDSISYIKTLGKNGEEHKNEK